MNEIAQKAVVPAVVVTAAFFGVKYFLSDDRLQRDLLKTKVKFNKNNLPHYTLSEVRGWAIKAEKGELYRWGSSQKVPIQVYNIMRDKNMKAVYWHPANMIQKAYKAMNGVNFSIQKTALSVLSPFFAITNVDPRDTIWTTISKLNKDQLRYLHNVWIDNASEGYSFYDWVNDEWTSSTAKDQLLSKLSAAGVGQFVNKNG